MIIYLMRHGEAVYPSSWSGNDSSRPLTKKGVKEVELTAKEMAARNLGIQKILSSPLTRAKETSAIIGKSLGIEPFIVKELASGAKAETLRQVVAHQNEESIMVVGHIPDLLSFLCRLIHNALVMEEGMAAGEIIAVETPPIKDGWAEGKILWRMKQK